MAAPNVAIDMSNAAPLLKIHYSPKWVETLAFKKSPTFAILGKDTNAGGSTVNYPVISDDVGGRSRDMFVAETQAGTVGIQGVQVAEPLIEDFSAFTIKGMAIEAAKGDLNAFMPTLQFSIDSAMRKVGRQASVDLFRSGYGVVGTIAVGGRSGSTITLAYREDAVNFNRAQTYFFAPDDTSDARASGATLTVDSVELSTGKVTFTAALSTITGLADGDVIIGEGDRQITSVSTRYKMAGLPAWIPSTKPAAANDLFPGWDRRKSSAFYGVCLDQSTTGGDIMNGTIDIVAEVNRLGGMVDLIIMNPNRAADLRKILQSQSRYDPSSIKSATGYIAFESFKFEGADVVEDRFCKINDVWALQRDTWEVISLGQVPKILNLDGNQFLRMSGADAYSGRCGYYSNLKCHAPGWNGRLILPTRT
jgi:hypothetical protein